MNANARIQWMHKKMLSRSYPNCTICAERFDISERQAGRDFKYMKEVLKAPVAYSASKKGYYYSKPYSLPVLFTTSNDDTYTSQSDKADSAEKLGVEEAVIQMQMPYSARIRTKDREALMELRKYILKKEAGKKNDIYECEYYSEAVFIADLMTIDADVELVSPDYLREKLIAKAKMILKNHAKKEEQAEKGE